MAIFAVAPSDTDFQPRPPGWNRNGPFANRLVKSSRLLWRSVEICAAKMMVFSSIVMTFDDTSWLFIIICCFYDFSIMLVMLILMSMFVHEFFLPMLA